jgi:hypothetical protein
MYDPEKSFNFVHHYEVSDNFLSVHSFGREPTETEKKKVIQDFEAAMLNHPKEHRMTTTLGILPPLESASEGTELK